MKKNEIAITEEEKQIAADELVQILLSLNLMKQTGAEICINVANYCAVRGDQKLLIERTGLSKSTISKMNKVGKLFNKAIQKFGKDSQSTIVDVNWSDVYKNADYYETLLNNCEFAEELSCMFDSKKLIDVTKQEVEETEEQVEESEEQIEESEEQVEDAVEQVEDTPFDRIMKMKSTIHSALGMLESVNDNYKKADMLAVIKFTIEELKKVYEM